MFPSLLNATSQQMEYRTTYCGIIISSQLVSCVIRLVSFTAKKTLFLIFCFYGKSFLRTFKSSKILVLTNPVRPVRD